MFCVQMVRNILDSVSELSRSQVAEEEGEGSADSATGGARAAGVRASGSRATQGAERGTGGGRVVRGAVLEAGDSAIGAELAGLMQDLNLAGTVRLSRSQVLHLTA